MLVVVQKYVEGVQEWLHYDFTADGGSMSKTFHEIDFKNSRSIRPSDVESLT